MIDIIIPSFNDEEGLYTSLFSIGPINYGQKVYIIDDASKIKIDYDKIFSMFNNFYPIEIYKMKENVGPGMARQKGIEISSNDFITFLDCGDEFITSSKLPFYLNILKENSLINIISTEHWVENEKGFYNVISSNHNRMHGKIYRRSFLKKYNISFCQEGSYANEDIGFNFLCRWIHKYIEKTGEYLELDDFLVLWKNNVSSLTRVNDFAFFYEKNNIGNAINFNHAFKTLQNLGLRKDEFVEEIYYVFVQQYISLINTLNERPEYKEKSFEGIKYFYNNWLKNEKINFDLFLEVYKKVMFEEVYSNLNHPFLSKINGISIIDLIYLLEKEENI